MFKRSQAILWFLTLFIFIFIMPSQSQANSFDELNTAFVSSVNQLPPINEASLTPEKNWQPSNSYFSENCKRSKSPYFVSVWIDIIGFEQMAKIDGVYYTNETPAAIIRYEAIACTLGYPRYPVKWEYKLDTYQQDNQFVGKLTATAVLYYRYNGIIIYDNITKIVYDYELIPSTYNTSSIPRLIIHESINSSKRLLEVNIDDAVTYYHVKTKNGSATKFIKIGQIAYTEKGVPYANFSITQHTIWNSTGYGVYHQGTEVTLDNSNFSFSAKTPFGNVSEANITKMIHPPSSMSILNVLIFVMFGLGYITCKFAAKVAKI